MLPFALGLGFDYIAIASLNVVTNADSLQSVARYVNGKQHEQDFIQLVIT